jgi:hypothetical protein
MPASVEQLVAKARATVEALRGMTVKEREQYPTVTFANDYNNFRRLVLEARPDLADIAPPQVGKHSDYDLATSKFAEMHAYYQQFAELLKKYV